MAKEKKSSKKSGAKASSSSTTELPSHLEEIRSRVFVNEQGASHTRAIEDPLAFAHNKYDNSFNLDKFKATLKIDIVEQSDEQVVFDLVGAFPPALLPFRPTSLSQQRLLRHRVPPVSAFCAPPQRRVGASCKVCVCVLIS
jgi:hypothetical protein